MILKRKKHHKLSRVAPLSDKDFYRAVKCEDCGKQFIMDVFGGWAIPWDFKMRDEHTLDAEDVASAITQYRNTTSSKWINLGEDECKSN